MGTVAVGAGWIALGRSLGMTEESTFEEEVLEWHWARYFQESSQLQHFGMLCQASPVLLI